MEKKSLKQVMKKTVTELVAEQLIGLVLRLKSGEKLPSERELIEQLGVGRSSLREALRSLEIMGLVKTQSGAGTFVTHDRSGLFRRPLEWGVFNGTKSLDDLLEARQVFESAIVELVAARIGDEQLAELEVIMREMETFGPPDFAGFLAADLRFHDLIAKTTGNDVLYDTIGLTRRILGEERTRRFETADDYRESCRYHRNVLEALKRRDPSAAREAMTAHMAYMKAMFSKQESRS